MKIVEKWKKWAGDSLFKKGITLIGAIFLFGLIVAIIQNCN